MTLEDAIAAANAMGLHVQNLFEREDGLWQANVREKTKMKANSKTIGDREYYHQYSITTTPTDALIEAINIAVERRAK